MNTVVAQADKLQIRSGFASETGKRETNEDYLALIDTNTQPHIMQGSVAAIADGMGGALGGRQAAETTVRGFIDACYSLPETLGVDRAPVLFWKSVSFILAVILFAVLTQLA